MKGTATECYCVFVDSQQVIQSDSADFAMLGANPNSRPVLSPARMAMDDLLVDVSTQEHEAGRPLLSVIVVHKYGDQEPGNGFYTLAEWLGFKFSDREAFWIAEFKRVAEYWRNNYRSAS